MLEFIYKFEELPLLVSGDVEAGLVSGEAEIRVHNDGEWFIGAICLDGFILGHGISTRTVLEADQGGWIDCAVHERLENGRFKDAIDDAARAKLADAGITNRTDRDEHSTYWGQP